MDKVYRVRLFSGEESYRLVIIYDKATAEAEPEVMPGWALIYDSGLTEITEDEANELAAQWLTNEFIVYHLMQRGDISVN